MRPKSALLGEGDQVLLEHFETGGQMWAKRVHDLVNWQLYRSAPAAGTAVDVEWAVELSFSSLTGGTYYASTHLDHPSGLSFGIDPWPGKTRLSGGQA